MLEALKLMCVLAHPDDESLGMGGTLARYAHEGIETYLVTATRGERGRFGDAKERPTPEVLAKTREEELLAAARRLGVKEVRFLDYLDGDLDRADPAEAIAKIVRHLRRIRPQVVVTFGPEGGYGHPDHIAICQFATAAAVCAADPDYGTPDGMRPHRMSKLYYMAPTEARWKAYQSAFKELKSTVDGVERRATPWPDWAVTTRIDSSAHWQIVWDAVLCHKTQLSIYSKLQHLSEDHHRGLWGTQEFYRVFSGVNGGRRLETDLFEGLRDKPDEEK
jgi:LmbE family N-acetylglucosaminyl deacetylase